MQVGLMWVARLLGSLLLFNHFLPGAQADERITSSFFGMHITNSDSSPWPPFEVGSIRNWDSGAIWKYMNPAPGIFDWP